MISEKGVCRGQISHNVNRPLRIVDALIVGRLPLWFGLSLVIVPFISLFTSADLSTALLTHGLAVSLVLLWLFGGRKVDLRRVFGSGYEPQPAR